MKIGIVTIYESITNLGSFLQGYAMKIVLEEMGHEVFFVQKETTLHSIKKCVFKINPKREFLLRCKKASYFYKDVKNMVLIFYCMVVMKFGIWTILILMMSCFGGVNNKRLKRLLMRLVLVQ